MATNAENQSKNGSDSVIPYDRNRVILTPDGARPHSTYINASFIEGYFNDESFIITQDPLQVGIRSYISCIVVVVMVTLSVCPPSQSIYGTYKSRILETENYFSPVNQHTIQLSLLPFIPLLVNF